MRNWMYPGPLMDKEPAPAGGDGRGSDTIAVDPGSPYEHDLEQPPAKPIPVKSDADKEVDRLKQENADLKRRREEAEEDARYWSRRGQPQPKETDEEPAAPAPREVIKEKPEKLLDDLTSEGLEALRKRGFITADQLENVLAENDKRTESKIAAARADAEFGARLGTEFPEIAEDSARISRGEKPKSEIFARASEIYRESIGLDPELKGSKSALILACRQAKAELTLKAQDNRNAVRNAEEERPRGDRPSPRERAERRRERIDSQRPDRASSPDESAGDPSFSSQQTEVMKRLGVKPEEFTKHRGARDGR